GSILVATDFSGSMMEMVKDKFNDSENGYSSIAGNKHFIRTDDLLPLGEHTFDIEAEAKKYIENDSDRLVFGCKANNEFLPFKDESFDCYIANLSLMLVDNHIN